MSATALKREDIEQIAEAFLADLGITEAPIDPIAIAKSLDYEVYATEYTKPEVSGTVRVTKGRVIINYCSTDSPARQNFTVAHELGHVRLHLRFQSGGFLEGRGFVDEGDTLYRADLNGLRSEIEQQANQFAAALLMPKAWVIERHQAGESALKMSRFFRVSESAMTYRLRNLELT